MDATNEPTERRPLAVITGASSGIGRETARELADRGYRVILAGRDAHATQLVVDEITAKHGDGTAGFHHLDLTSLHAVDESAIALAEMEPRIDLLIDNAGVAGHRGTTKDGFELTFGVNHLGHFLWTNRLLANVESAAPARIVVVASIAHFDAPGIDFESLQSTTKSVTGMAEYSVSKLANVLFARRLAQFEQGRGVSVYSLHPGVIDTNVWRRIPGFLMPIVRRYFKMKPAVEGIVATITASTQDGIDDRSGDYLDADGSFQPPSNVVTDELADELWTRSIGYVNEVLGPGALPPTPH